MWESTHESSITRTIPEAKSPISEDANGVLRPKLVELRSNRHFARPVRNLFPSSGAPMNSESSPNRQSLMGFGRIRKFGERWSPGKIQIWPVGEVVVEARWGNNELQNAHT
jgi:hypothetical protein